MVAKPAAIGAHHSGKKTFRKKRLYLESATRRQPGFLRVLGLSILVLNRIYTLPLEVLASTFRRTAPPPERGESRWSVPLHEGSTGSEVFAFSPMALAPHRLRPPRLEEDGRRQAQIISSTPPSEGERVRVYRLTTMSIHPPLNLIAVLVPSTGTVSVSRICWRRRSLLLTTE